MTKIQAACESHAASSEKRFTVLFISWPISLLAVGYLTAL